MVEGLVLVVLIVGAISVVGNIFHTWGRRDPSWTRDELQGRHSGSSVLFTRLKALVSIMKGLWCAGIRCAGMRQISVVRRGYEGRRSRRKRQEARSKR